MPTETSKAYTVSSPKLFAPSFLKKSKTQDSTTFRMKYHIKGCAGQGGFTQ
ncbi:hypothetical protein RYX36_014727, partial [Vicia faba]